MFPRDSRNSRFYGNQITKALGGTYVSDLDKRREDKVILYSRSGLRIR